MGTPEEGVADEGEASGEPGGVVAVVSAMEGAERGEDEFEEGGGGFADVFGDDR